MRKLFFTLYLIIFGNLNGLTAFADPIEPTWTPLILASDFDGIRVDVTTACVGIIGILIIIVAVALLKRAFTN